MSYLRKQIQSAIRSRHPELSEPKMKFWLKRYIAFLSHQGNWFLVFLHVMALFLIFTFVSIPFLEFIKFEQKTPSILIDQRTSNVATMISMTLAIVAILLSNLAIKEPMTYKLLFKKSSLYLAVYYILSTIFFLIVISTLRDVFTGKYEYLYNRAVLAGTYLSLGTIFFIGYLFYTVIHFSNSGRIQQMLKIELENEINYNISLDLLAINSKNEFLRLMESRNIRSYNLAEIMDAVATAQDQIEDSEEETEDNFEEFTLPSLLVYDIDLKKLEKLLNQISPEISVYYKSSISLNTNTAAYDTFIWMQGIDRSFKRKLKSCLCLKTTEKRLERSNEFRQFFDKRLEEYTEDGQIKKMEGILELYEEIEEKEMKYY